MSEPTRKGWLRALWAGELSLAEAFWWYGIVISFLINAIATLTALALATFEAPGWLLVLLYLAPTPYDVVALVGVWRSAARWRGRPEWASLARLAIVAWFALGLVL